MISLAGVLLCSRLFCAILLTDELGMLGPLLGAWSAQQLPTNLARNLIIITITLLTLLTLNRRRIHKNHNRNTSRYSNIMLRYRLPLPPRILEYPTAERAQRAI